MIDNIRLFVALAIPQEVKTALSALRSELKPGLPSLRWVRPEGIHLTLMFLGEVPGDRIDSIRAALARCPGQMASMRLDTAGLGVFPHQRAPRIFWIGFHSPPETLFRLQQQVAQAMEGQGFERERRDFRPHLTIGRFRLPLRRTERDLLAAGLERNAERRFGVIPVSRLSLFSSTLLPSGAIYGEVGGWPLTGPGEQQTR